LVNHFEKLVFLALKLSLLNVSCQQLQKLIVSCFTILGNYSFLALQCRKLCFLLYQTFAFEW